MPSRYDDRRIGINSNEQYSKMFKERGLKFARQYFTPALKYPTQEQIQKLEIISHEWGTGDRFYKLAFEYYGRSDLHWIIAWYNKTMEPDVSIGDVVYIPLPLDRILNYLDV